MSLRVILASAGSGKTQRLAQLAIETLLKGRGVLAITFTRNAAAELRERILALLTDPTALPAYRTLAQQTILGQAPLYTQTIDSLIRELYQRLAPLLGIAVYEDLIVEEEDRIEVAHSLTHHLLTHIRTTATLHLLRLRIAHELENRARRIDPEGLMRRELLKLTQESPLRLSIRKVLHQAVRNGQLDALEPSWHEALALDKREALFTPILMEALETYRLKHQKLFLPDIAALVQLAARHLEGVIAEHTNFYDHLLVDEAQDTSPQQWEILQPLIQELSAREGGAVTLIGDPKQSIYAWREADFRQLVRFYEQADLPESLNQNFRSEPAIVEWNNQLYAGFASRLRNFLHAKESTRKSSKKSSPGKESAISAIDELYSPGLVSQRSTRSGQGAVRVFQLPYDRDDAVQQMRVNVLREILADLTCRGIPPEETAFLVRTNHDITRLMELLPGIPLQVQQIPLRTCTSLTVTLRYLLGEAGPVEAAYAEQYDMLADMEKLPQTLREASIALEKWKVFYELSRKWAHALEHNAFWKLFLSELHAFLHRHPMYDVEEIGRWWRERAQHITIEVPPSRGVYPILTIHRAKGLAWEAVILPFAEWDLLRAVWKEPAWRNVRRALLPPVLELALAPLSPLLPADAPPPLPLKVSSENKTLAAIYEEYFVEHAVENLNLHYVATTRPRRYLYLIAAECSAGAHASRGVHTWRGFWTEPNLSADLWK